MTELAENFGIKGVFIFWWTIFVIT